MTLANPECLQAASCPLHGIINIEASAGTGKTYNLCLLYERLVVEKGLPVNQILVVTFTEAAAAELRDRIYRRLHATVHAPDTPPPARQRIAAALLAFDDAAIFTIHGFCHRALTRLAFAAGQPLVAGEVVSGDDLLQQVSEDFWRRQVLPLAGLEARSLSNNTAFSPQSLARALRDTLARPLAQRRPEITSLPAFNSASYQRLLHELQQAWEQEADPARQVIIQALLEKQLNGNKYREASVTKAWAAWQALIAGNPPNATLLESAHRLTASRLKDGCNKGCSPPAHPLFTAFDHAFPPLGECAAYLDSLPARLLLQLVAEAPTRLEALKASRRVLTFDDMLHNLYRALAGAEQLPGLAEQLRQAYPAALIDEFQDTDPLQLAIFRTLYDDGRADGGPLFLVGDPKQAIYSFRGADLHTYLAAKQRAHHHYLLGHNQRSTQSMIDAVNALFEANPDAFRIPGLSFHPVSKGEKAIPSLNDASAMPMPALAFWPLEEALAGETASKADIQLACAQASATEIVRLLTAADAGQITLGERPLQPGDIAILVRSHAQGKRMKEALTAAGISAVELSDASVFASFEAEEMRTILHAIIEPGRTRLLRAALATVLLGQNSSQIEAINGDENALGTLSTQFASYRQRWLEQGFAAMWQQVLSEHSVMARLLQLPHGERRATNLAHLSELSSAESRLRPGMEALLHWLTAQSSARGGTSATAQLRLESDENLVRIITKHRSKGLQYPIVFCPFLWDDGNPSRLLQSSIPLRYHDADGQTILDFAPGAFAYDTARREAEEERLRLIYVALTRAIYRCYAVGGVANTSRSSGPSSLLNWLVAGKGIPVEDWSRTGKEPTPDRESVRQAWQKLARTNPDALGFMTWPERRSILSLRSTTSAPIYRARETSRRLRPAWLQHSFSSLLRLSTPAVDDHGDLMPAQAIEPCPEHIPSTDILHFPRGTRAGDCIHTLLERVDFAADTRHWRPLIEETLRHYLPSPEPLKETRVHMLQNWLGDLFATELLPGLRLRNIPPQLRLSELAFHFPAQALSAGQLTEVLQKLGRTPPSLGFEAFSGFLRGSIDLVFAHDERYYVVDWKSNYLGHEAADYRNPALDGVIRQHAYDLQALLYQLALHRSLRHRLGPAYDYERHFGGALYLFIRAVRPGWPGSGIWHWRPQENDMAALDRLFPPGELCS